MRGLGGELTARLGASFMPRHRHGQRERLRWIKAVAVGVAGKESRHRPGSTIACGLRTADAMVVNVASVCR